MLVCPTDGMQVYIFFQFSFGRKIYLQEIENPFQQGEEQKAVI